MASDTPPDRLPPRSQEAERSVLGSMLRDNAIIDDVVHIVQTDSFYEDAHQKIFQAIVDLHNKPQPVDLITLGEALLQRNQHEDIGGLAYLGLLWDAAPTAANAVYYAQIVRDRSLVRNLIHASTEILRDAYDQAQPPEEMLAAAERMILEIAEKGTTGKTTTLADSVNDAFTRFDARRLGTDLSISGISTGYTDLDEITAGLQNSELVIIAARPSVGKCLAHESELVLADGSLATIEQIVARRQAQLLTLQDDLRFKWTEPSAFVDDGLKPVYRVTTRLGRQIETTASHPYLTLAGWRPLAELTVGERIAVPRTIPVFGQETLRACEVKLLAYLIGDGCLTDNTPEFTNSNPRVREDFTTAVAEFGGAKVRYEDSGGTRTPTLAMAGGSAYIQENRPAFGRCLPAAIRTRYHHTSRAFARLLGKNTRAKTIPDKIFLLTRPLVALFLNRLFATAGWATVLNGEQIQLGYATVNERLARQIQHLLLRFGVIASLRRRAMKYLNGRRFAWQLDVTDSTSIRRFIAEIGMFGKEEAIERVRAALEKQHYKTNSDVYWDEIVSIEAVGVKQVYDLTIPDTHNFVANDICVHNTAFALNLVRNMAVDNGHPVFFVSLEQSRIELAERLLCCQSRVDSHKLRKGNTSRDDMDKLIAAAEVLREAKLFIDDTPGQGMMRIAANARRLQRRNAIKVVVIDYLQLIDPENRRDPRQEQVAQISRRLKFLARELSIPVVALAQVNRSSEDRQDHRPRLADLRESGSIEQDADTVMLLHCPDRYEPGQHEGILEVIIGKQRNGPTGEITLAYLKQYMRFENFAVGTPFEG